MIVDEVSSNESDEKANPSTPIKDFAVQEEDSPDKGIASRLRKRTQSKSTASPVKSEDTKKSAKSKSSKDILHSKKLKSVSPIKLKNVSQKGKPKPTSKLPPKLFSTLMPLAPGNISKILLSLTKDDFEAMKITDQVIPLLDKLDLDRRGKVIPDVLTSFFLVHEGTDSHVAKAL